MFFKAEITRNLFRIYSFFSRFEKKSLDLSVLLVAFFLSNLASAGEPNPPRINDNAHLSIRISGHVSAGLEIKLFGEYDTDIKWGCLHTSDSLIAHYVEGAEREAFVRTELEITRDANNYSAIAHPDALLPGRCDWRFAGVVAEIRTPAGKINNNAWVILTKRKDSQLNGNANPHIFYKCKPSWKVLLCRHENIGDPYIVYDGAPDNTFADFELDN